MRAVDRLGAVDDRILSDLSPSQTEQLGRHLADSSEGSAATQLVNDLEPTNVRHLLDADDVVMTDRLASAYTRGTIGADDVSRLTRGLDEGTIDTTTVRNAVSKATAMSNQGYSPTALRVGDEANTRDPYYTVRYDDDFARDELVDGQVPDSHKPNADHPGYDPPHEQSGIVIEAETTQPQSYIRAHGQDNQQGAWMMPGDEFVDVATRDGRSGLEREYALQRGAPEYATRVTIPEGEPVRVSTVGPQESLPGGGMQIEIRRFDDEIEGNWFEEPDELDNLIDN